MMARFKTLLPVGFLGVLLGSLLGGCDLLVDGEVEGGGTPAAPIGPKPPGADGAAGPAAAAAAEEDQYAYNPIGKRDPFRSFLNLGPGPEGPSLALPTQKFEIDQYKLVGLVWGIDRPRALVQDPDGMGHVLEIGTYIGKNWGKVTQITSGEVIVTEEYQTLDGELVVNNINLTLPVGDSATLVQ